MSASQELHEVFQLRRPVTRFLIRVLRPLINMMIRLGVSSYAVTEIVRWLYVDIAMSNREFMPGREQIQTKSRAALLTGLSRREVLRLYSMPNPDSDATIANYSRVARVISGWLLDPRYSDSKGKVLDIPVKAKNGPSFFSLVNDYAGDIPYRTVLEELLVAGTITQQPDGRLKLIRKALRPDKSSDKPLTEAGNFAESLLLALDKSMREPEKSNTSHCLVQGQQISIEKIDKLRRKVADETDKFTSRLEKVVDESLSNKKSGGKGKEIGVGVYFFEN